MYDDCGNVSNAIDVLKQVVVSVEETVIDEVVTLNPRQREGHLRFTEVVNQLLVRKKL